MKFSQFYFLIMIINWELKLYFLKHTEKKILKNIFFINTK